jgi:hypothetical protein
MLLLQLAQGAQRRLALDPFLLDLMSQSVASGVL